MAEFKLFIDSVDGSLDIDGHANAPISYIIGVLADTCLDVLAQGVEGSKEFNDSIESLLVTIKNRADVVNSVVVGFCVFALINKLVGIHEYE